MRFISSWKDWRFPIGVHRAKAMGAHLLCSTIHADDSPEILYLFKPLYRT
jgi:hypothetical protein